MVPANSHGIKTPEYIRILLVDDQPSYHRHLSLFLERQGHIVSSASSGEEAVEFAEEVDVALVDMGMPGKNGLETMLLLQSRNPKLKLIGTSGRTESEFRCRLDRIGVQEFLPKPFSVEMVIRRVHHVMGLAAA